MGRISPTPDVFFYPPLKLDRKHFSSSSSPTIGGGTAAGSQSVSVRPAGGAVLARPARILTRSTRCSSSSCCYNFLPSNPPCVLAPRLLGFWLVKRQAPPTAQELIKKQKRGRRVKDRGVGGTSSGRCREGRGTYPGRLFCPAPPPPLAPPPRPPAF